RLTPPGIRSGIEPSRARPGGAPKVGEPSARKLPDDPGVIPQPAAEIEKPRPEPIHPRSAPTEPGAQAAASRRKRRVEQREEPHALPLFVKPPRHREGEYPAHAVPDQSVRPRPSG